MINPITQNIMYKYTEKTILLKYLKIQLDTDLKIILLNDNSK